MSITINKLLQMRERLITADAELFMGLPDAWYDKPHWVCINGHVSSRYLKTELNGDCCLACCKPVILFAPIAEVQFQLMIKEYSDD